MGGMGGLDAEGGGVDPPPCQQDFQTYLAPKAPEIFICVTKAQTWLTHLLVNEGHKVSKINSKQ